MLNGSEQLGPLIYTSETLVPPGMLFMPMNERQLLETMIARNIYSFVVDKNSSDSFPVSQGEMKEELNSLPASKGLDLEVRVAIPK